MAYVRGSTPLPITEVYPECGRPPREPLPENATVEERVAAFLRRHEEDHRRWEQRRAEGKRGLCPKCTSPWYVFRHCDSGEGREEQLLAVWGGGNDDPLLDYPAIKDILERNSLEEIPGFDQAGDPYGVLSFALRAWVEEVEDAYPPSR